MKYNGVELYENGNGEVGVLYSPGYGAGWGTWGKKETAYDKRIVEKFLDDPNLFHSYKRITELEDFMEKLGYENHYCGGADDLRVTFISKGRPFRINEYDGYESITFFEDDGYICF